MASQQTLEQAPRVVVRSFERGIDGVRATGEAATVAAGTNEGKTILLVSYGPSPDPAGRDVWFDTETRDWSGAKALSFCLRPEHAMHLSLSFFDANGVAYTTWLDAPRGKAWQELRVPLDTIRPNPYFQQPNAKLGLPLDLRDIRAIGFAPQNDDTGQFAIDGFVITR